MANQTYHPVTRPNASKMGMALALVICMAVAILFASWNPWKASVLAPPYKGGGVDPRGAVLMENPIENAIQAIERIAQQKNKNITGDYLDMAIAASRLIDSELDEEALRRQIESMADIAREKWALEEAPDRKVQALSKVIFETFGFSVPEASAPVISGEGIFETYALPGLLKGGQGYCEGLSTVYFLIAERGQLPVSIITMPIHTLCQANFNSNKTTIYIETLQSGAQRSEFSTKTMNSVTDAGLKSDVYLSPLTKHQFLNLHLNALAYGLIQQPHGPNPLDMSQMVRLANVIEMLDPNRPESLDTVALIHFKAGEIDRACAIINRTIHFAIAYGAPAYIIEHYEEAESEYLG